MIGFYPIALTEFSAYCERSDKEKFFANNLITRKKKPYETKITNHRQRLCCLGSGVLGSGPRHLQPQNGWTRLLPKPKASRCTDGPALSLIHISEPTSRTPISYA